MLLLALESPELIADLFARWSYLAPFAVLLLCGVGLPLPEEVTLIGSGLLVYQGHADFWLITLVCSIAILLGDSVPFWLGKRYGMNALRVRWVARILHPERFNLLTERFERHGNWAVFTCRFLPGLRIPGYFTAGTLRMRYSRFLLLDGLGVLLSVPLSIKLGEIFGGSIENLQDDVENLHLILAFGIVSLLLIMFVRARGLRRSREARAKDREAEAVRHQDAAAPAAPAPDLAAVPPPLPAPEGVEPGCPEEPVAEPGIGQKRTPGS